MSSLNCSDQGFVDARYVVESVGVSLGAELGEVVVAVFVFGKENGWVAVVFRTAVGVVAADVELGADNGLDARLVGRPDELKRPHHVAVVRDGQRVHAVAHRRVHEFAHVADRLQNAELAVRVQVDERNVVAEGLGCLRRGLGWARLGCSGLEVRSLELGRLVHDGVRVLDLGTLDDAQAAQLEKAFGRSVHVVGRVVGLVEPRVEELVVELGERGPLELSAASAGNGAEVRRLVFGIDDRFVRQLLDGLGQPVVFRAHDVDVELDVVAHDVGRLGEVLVKFGQHLRKRMPVLLGAFRRDAVDLGRSVWDGESIRLYDAVST